MKSTDKELELMRVLREEGPINSVELANRLLGPNLPRNARQIINSRLRHLTDKLAEDGKEVIRREATRGPTPSLYWIEDVRA